MVPDVPDHDELPSPGRPAAAALPPLAVLFDFHGTLAQVEDPVAWVQAATQSLGAELDAPRATALADRLVTAGRAGGPLPARIPPHLAEVWADRDLYEYAHRAAYAGLAGTVPGIQEGLVDALYERVLRPEGWRVYPDTLVTLAALHAAGIPVAVLSNIGFDIRPIAEALGFHKFVSEYVLSFEVGRCKPDPAIFQHACAALHIEPEHTLMVGDTPADAAAVTAGCRAYILPAAPPGHPNGLTAILNLLHLPTPDQPNN
jgi:HAD superfamily hydrolase (TIGR01509 family)